MISVTVFLDRWKDFNVQGHDVHGAVNLLGCKEDSPGQCEADPLFCVMNDKLLEKRVIAVGWALPEDAIAG